MDKRFLLALGLTAIVVLVTPLLFPPPVSTRRPAARNAREDSLRRDTARQQSRVPVIERGPLSHTDSLVRGSLPPVRPETTLVSADLAEYQFTSLGAVPVSVKMRSYRALDGSSRPVDLVRGGEPLLRYRLVVPGDTIALDRVSFSLTRTTNATGEVLTYTANVANLQAQVRYAFVPDSYLVKVGGTVTGPSSDAARFLLIEFPSGLQSAEADSVEDQRHLAYAVKPRGSSARGIGFGKLNPGERRLMPGPITWVAGKNKYFIVGVLAPENGVPFAEVAVTGGPRTSRAATRASATLVQPLQGGSFSFELYTGPQEWKRLVALGRDFENSNPYGGFLQPIVQPFATIVMRILLWMRDQLALGYGWVLVIFGVAVRIILWPLNQKAMRTSLKMTRLQPELAEIQKKHRNDPAKLQTEMMRVYREHGMSPFSAFSGCLPMLLPMPVLFALFFVFQNTIEFRGVPFLWLHDISLKDPLYILPLIMGVSMFALSWIGMRNTPPNPQSKMMLYVLPVFMTFLLLNLAAGLNLYYAVQNIAAFPQQWLIANERGKAVTGKS